jgi:hypothetical protein
MAKLLEGRPVHRWHPRLVDNQRFGEHRWHALGVVGVDRGVECPGQGFAIVWWNRFTPRGVYFL